MHFALFCFFLLAATNEDFISNNTLWMSELLPAFEDEAIVDNLIELPVSPERSTEDSKNNNNKQSLVNTDNTDENSPKETSSEFSTFDMKQTIVTSLLSDLKKIVKAEDNPEANKLLNNLERALNVNYKNNTELLMTCLNISNELQSPQKTLSKDVERSGNTFTQDKNEEKSEKISNVNICNEKLPLDVDTKLENTTKTTTVNDNNLSVKSLSFDNENNLNINLSKKDTSCAEDKNSQTDEKLALELLKSLGKLLSGQTEDATTMQLLKNIGKALNVASNNGKTENEVQTERQGHNVQQTSVKASESGGTPHSTRTAHRRSFQLESKSKVSKFLLYFTIILIIYPLLSRITIGLLIQPLEKTHRRSISGTPTRKHKDTSELEDRKKPLLSDPSHPVNKKTTISETCNVRKGKLHQIYFMRCHSISARFICTVN